MEFAHLHTVSLWELRAKCAHCDYGFRSFTLPDMSYGYWLLHTVDGDAMALLCCFDNPVFDEVRCIVEALLGNQSKVGKKLKLRNDRETGKALHAVMPVSFDPLKGSKLTTRRPQCPRCNSSAVDLFDYNPARGVVTNLPVATYNNWLARTLESRKQAVVGRLSELGYIP